MTDYSKCPWCGSSLDCEDDGDGENGPHLTCWCSNDDCPGDPTEPNYEEYFGTTVVPTANLYRLAYDYLRVLYGEVNAANGTEFEVPEDHVERLVKLVLVPGTTEREFPYSATK